MFYDTWNWYNKENYVALWFRWHFCLVIFDEFFLCAARERWKCDSPFLLLVWYFKMSSSDTCFCNEKSSVSMCCYYAYLMCGDVVSVKRFRSMCWNHKEFNLLSTNRLRGRSATSASAWFKADNLFTFLSIANDEKTIWLRWKKTLLFIPN